MRADLLQFVAGRAFFAATQLFLCAPTWFIILERSDVRSRERGRMLMMSRIDIFGDRVCVVTSLLIMGWFIYNVAF
jgi:hypothetical protein